MKYTNIDKSLPYVVGRMTGGQPTALAAFSDRQQATSWHGTVSGLPQFKDCELFDNVNNKSIIDAKELASGERELAQG